MSTIQTDAFWGAQQEILEDFSWWLDLDFSTAETLLWNYHLDNELPQETLIRLNELYNDRLSERAEADRVAMSV